MISFNKPPFVGNEMDYVKEAIEVNNKLCGDGPFTQKSNAWIEDRFQVRKTMLTTSCTHALEMSAILIDIQPGDEVIVPSFTFVSTVNAFVLRGAKLVFVDIRPDTLNIDETLIESAITEKTRAIIPVHYAGVSCEMSVINEIAKKHKLFVIEDAAQGVMATYEGKALGTIGDIGCFSFHETKNYTMGEGGAILIQNPQFIERAEIIREKGTNRSNFLRGQVDKYTWVDVGSSYLPSEINAAYLFAQLQYADQINEDRLASWNQYYKKLEKLENINAIERPYIPDNCNHNAHMFYIKCKDIEERTRLIAALKKKEISAVFHYIPLHSSKAGQEFGRFHGEDVFTTKESERLLRLPLYYGLTKREIDFVVSSIYNFYEVDE